MSHPALASLVIGSLEAGDSFGKRGTMTEQELTTQVEELKALWASLHKAKVNRPKRNKYQKMHAEMRENDLPVVRLNESVFTNESEQSMQQQFNKVAEKAGETAYSVVFTDQGKFLIDFDNERAEEKFAALIEGISEGKVTQLSNDLLRNTR